MLNFMRKSNLLFTFIFVLSLVDYSEACTRVLHVSKDNKFIITGRNMDWFERYPGSLWKFPRGISRDGLNKQNSLKWTSKYGSIVMVQTASGQSGAMDGINEEGLVANLLYLTETSYGKRDITRKGVSTSIVIQYILDNFKTVDEAIQTFKSKNIQCIPVPIPNSDHLPTLHFAISDSLGDSAIVEYIDGKLEIHHSSEYQVMTNSPTFEKQLALTKYWDAIGGDVFLPGTRKSADRFVRASYYNKALPDANNYQEAVAGVMSVIRNASSPFGLPNPTKPNISATVWRTISDHKNKIYFYESTLSPSVIWVEFKKLKFDKNSDIQRLDLDKYPNLAGEVSKKFVKAKALEFSRP